MMSHIEPEVPLAALDPESRDPGYWHRFQQQVMESVSPVLARRREVRITIGDAVLSWSRYFVPFALAAAASAGIFLARAVDNDVLAVAGVEEFLVTLQQNGEAPLPAFFLTEEAVDRDVILLAVEGI